LAIIQLFQREPDSNCAKKLVFQGGYCGYSVKRLVSQYRAALFQGRKYLGRTRVEIAEGATTEFQRNCRRVAVAGFDNLGQRSLWIKSSLQHVGYKFAPTRQGIRFQAFAISQTSAR